MPQNKSIMAFSFVAIVLTLGCLGTCQAAGISIVDLTINGLEQEDALSAPFPQGSPIVLAWRLFGDSVRYRIDCACLYVDVRVMCVEESTMSYR